MSSAFSYRPSMGQPQPWSRRRPTTAEPALCRRGTGHGGLGRDGLWCPGCLTRRWPTPPGHRPQPAPRPTLCPVAGQCLRQHGLANFPDPAVASSGPAKGGVILDKQALLAYPEAGGEPGLGRLPHRLGRGRDLQRPERRRQPRATSGTCSPLPAVCATTASRTSPTPTARVVSTSPAPGSTATSSRRPSSPPPGRASPPRTAQFIFPRRARAPETVANDSDGAGHIAQARAPKL